MKCAQQNLGKTNGHSLGPPSRLKYKIHKKESNSIKIFNKRTVGKQDPWYLPFVYYVISLCLTSEITYLRQAGKLFILLCFTERTVVTGMPSHAALSATHVTVFDL